MKDKGTWELIPRPLFREALNTNSVILITDYYIARRQRVHVALLPWSDEWHAEKEIVDCLKWILDQGHHLVVVCHATHRKKRIAYKLNLTHWEVYP